MRFSYGTDGRPLALWYDEVSYYYITNLQGDVVAIVNSSGTTVVSYVYDAWGRVITTVDNTNINLGEINPLRYRGYIYDQETGLYYLQSRYYNPTWGRFLNADTFVFTGQSTGLSPRWRSFDEIVRKFQYLLLLPQKCRHTDALLGKAMVAERKMLSSESVPFQESKRRELK